MPELEKQYADRNPIAQGHYYIRHLMAMTSEKLHSKSDIAKELAHRDMLIDDLKAELKAAFNVGTEIAYRDDVIGRLENNLAEAKHEIKTLT